MKNAQLVLIVFLGGGWMTNSCRADREVTEYLAQQTVTLESTQGWRLVIADDGSGTLSCQGMYTGIVRWPAATFAFNEVRWLPPFQPSIREYYPFYWTYQNYQTTDYQRYGLPDTSWALSWFEQAHQKLELSAPSVSKRLLKQWRVNPPTGVRH